MQSIPLHSALTSIQAVRALVDSYYVEVTSSKGRLIEVAATMQQVQPNQVPAKFKELATALSNHYRTHAAICRVLTPQMNHHAALLEADAVQAAKEIDVESFERQEKVRLLLGQIDKSSKKLGIILDFLGEPINADDGLRVAAPEIDNAGAELQEAEANLSAAFNRGWFAIGDFISGVEARLP